MPICHSITLVLIGQAYHTPSLNQEKEQLLKCKSGYCFPRKGKVRVWQEKNTEVRSIQGHITRKRPNWNESRSSDFQHSPGQGHATSWHNVICSLLPLHSACVWQAVLKCMTCSAAVIPRDKILCFHKLKWRRWAHYWEATNVAFAHSVTILWLPLHALVCSMTQSAGKWKVILTP